MEGYAHDAPPQVPSALPKQPAQQQHQQLQQQHQPPAAESQQLQLGQVYQPADPVTASPAAPAASRFVAGFGNSGAGFTAAPARSVSGSFPAAAPAAAASPGEPLLSSIAQRTASVERPLVGMAGAWQLLITQEQLARCMEGLAYHPMPAHCATPGAPCLPAHPGCFDTLLPLTMQARPLQHLLAWAAAAAAP